MQMSKAMAAQKMPQEQIDANIAATSPLSADKTTGIVEVNFDAKTNMDITEEQRDELIQAIEDNQGDLKVAWNGTAFQASEPGGLSLIHI